MGLVRITAAEAGPGANARLNWPVCGRPPQSPARPASVDPGTRPGRGNHLRRPAL